MLKLALFASVVTGCFVGSTQMQAANEQFYQHICTDSQYAYEHGYNRAQQHERMSTEWAQRCAPEVRAERQQAYLAGYQAAAANAPAEVNVGVGIGVSGSTASGGTSACTFDSDCGQGRACRAIDGGKVCMGYGATGDYCWFGSDCVSQSCDLGDNGAKYCR